MSIKKENLGNLSAVSLSEAYRCSEEIWKSVKIPEHPKLTSLYEVSNFGRVRVRPRKVRGVAPDGSEVWALRKERILLPTGRAHVVRFSIDGKQFGTAVGRVVALVFVKGYKEGLVVRHRDDDPTNNVPSNLTWGTQRDNINDRQTRDRQAKGSGHGSAKLTEKDVIKIRKLLRGARTQRDVATQFGVSTGVISRIKNNHIWSHV